MSDVLALDGPKLAGLHVVYFVPVAAVQPLPDVDESGLVLLGDVLLAAGQAWAELQGTIYSAALDVASTSINHGEAFAHELGGFYNGDRPEVAAQLRAMQGRRFVLLYRDHENQVRLVGGPGAGLLFSHKLATGSKPGQAKGYAWSFKGRTAGPALFYQGALPAGATPPPPPAGGLPVPIYNSRGRLLGVAQPGQSVTITSPFRVTVKIK